MANNYQDYYETLMKTLTPAISTPTAAAPDDWWSPSTDVRTLYTTRGTTAPTRRQVTTAIPPGVPQPGVPAIPKFQLPERKEERVRELYRQGLYPMRGMRQGLQQALLKAAQEKNPAVKKMLIGEALKQFGTGVGGIAGQARQYAEATYGRERAEEIQAAQINWQAQVQNLYRQYETDLSSWFRQWEQTTTAGPMSLEETAWQGRFARPQRPTRGTWGSLAGGPASRPYYLG